MYRARIQLRYLPEAQEERARNGLQVPAPAVASGHLAGRPVHRHGPVRLSHSPHQASRCGARRLASRADGVAQGGRCKMGNEPQKRSLPSPVCSPHNADDESSN
jgi:hypothetical protein